MCRSAREFWFRIAGLGVMAAMVSPQARSAAAAPLPESPDQTTEDVAPANGSDDNASEDDSTPTLIRVEPAEYLHRVLRPVGLDSHERHPNPPPIHRLPEIEPSRGFEPSEIDGTSVLRIQLREMLPSIQPHAPPVSA